LTGLFLAYWAQGKHLQGQGQRLFFVEVSSWSRTVLEDPVPDCAARVDGTVEVAQPVGEVVEAGGRHTARVAARAEADHKRQNVPRSPAELESSS